MATARGDVRYIGDTVLMHDPAMGAYRFDSQHPMQPERFLLAVELLRSWGLLTEGEPSAGHCAVRPGFLADDELLQLGHSAEYIRFVRSASAAPETAYGHGIGMGDTPAFRGMHEAAACAVGATVDAMRAVTRGDFTSAINLSGGLHHAHHDHASGFCIYNDVVIAIEDATRAQRGLRVAYIDIDAHHGDGVEAAFVERDDVLTLSVHESGRYLFPGTGRATDTGNGDGAGYTIDVPLPPFADPDCYSLVFESVIEPAVLAFHPDVLFVQAGADTHRADPLTHLAQSIRGYVDLVGSLLSLSAAACGGRTVLAGGGGYRPCSEVPRMWAIASCAALGIEAPETLPAEWLLVARECAERLDTDPPQDEGTFTEASAGITDEQHTMALQTTSTVVRQVREASALIDA